MQSTRLAQHEYINAFSTDGWRDAIHTSVESNHDYLYPPTRTTAIDESETNSMIVPRIQTLDDVERDRAPSARSRSSTAHVNACRGRACQPACPPAGQTTAAAPPATATTAPPVAPPPAPSSTRPSPADTEAALDVRAPSFPTAPTQPAQSAAPTPQTCHPERSEGPPRSLPIDHRRDPTPKRRRSLRQPTTNPTQTNRPTQQRPANRSTTIANPTPTGAPNREPYAVHFDHTHRLIMTAN